jgi:hypothetical protein
VRAIAAILGYAGAESVNSFGLANAMNSQTRIASGSFAECDFPMTDN